MPNVWPASHFHVLSDYYNISLRNRFKNIFSKNAKYSEEFPRGIWILLLILKNWPMRLYAAHTMEILYTAVVVHLTNVSMDNEPMCQLTKNGPLCSSLQCSKPEAI